MTFLALWPTNDERENKTDNACYEQAGAGKQTWNPYDSVARILKRERTRTINKCQKQTQMFTVILGSYHEHDRARNEVFVSVQYGFPTKATTHPIQHPYASQRPRTNLPTA